MTADVNAYVTATSIMLGAYGFFYSAVSPRMDAADGLATPAEDPDKRTEQERTLRSGIGTARVLGFVALLVFLIFLKPAVEEVGDIHFDLDHYSALDVSFVVLVAAWLPIAVLTLARAVSLKKNLKDYEQT
jgi:hypothetical protein